MARTLMDGNIGVSLCLRARDAAKLLRPDGHQAHLGAFDLGNKMFNFSVNLELLIQAINSSHLKLNFELPRNRTPQPASLDTVFHALHQITGVQLQQHNHKLRVLTVPVTPAWNKTIFNTQLRIIEGALKRIADPSKLTSLTINGPQGNKMIQTVDTTMEQDVGRVTFAIQDPDSNTIQVISTNDNKTDAAHVVQTLYDAVGQNSKILRILSALANQKTTCADTEARYYYPEDPTPFKEPDGSDWMLTGMVGDGTETTHVIIPDHNGGVTVESTLHTKVAQKICISGPSHPAQTLDPSDSHYTRTYGYHIDNDGNVTPTGRAFEGREYHAAQGAG